MAEITYPFALDTLGKVKATGHDISLTCHICRHRVFLDIDNLIARLGEDHGCLDADLRPYFYCQRCRAAGRDDKNFAFILHAPGPDTGPYARASRGR